VLTSEGNAFVMNNTAESLMKKLPLNALSRLWGRFYSIEIPAFARPFFYKMYAFLFGANLDEVEKPLKQYASLQEFFSRKLKPGVRKIDPIDEIISPVDGRVMSCGVVHINKDTENVLIEQVKGISYPLHHFLGYGMKDALQALNAATNDVTEDEMKSYVGAPHLHFLTSEEHEKKLYYCVLYLAPGDYHRYHSPCDWNALERKHVSGYLFPVMPLFVKTLRGLFALNERVVLHGKWKYGDFHYVLVGATNVGGIVLHFDNTLNTNIKRKKTRKSKKDSSVKKEEANSETKESETTDKKATEESNTAEVMSEKHLEENGYDKYLEMRRRVYCKGGIPLHKGEDIGYFKMGSTVVMLFEHSDQFEWGIKPGDRVLLGEALSAQTRNTYKQQ
jgi:phosphatidylserine decarboxylase